MKFNLQYQPFHSEDPKPKRPLVSPSSSYSDFQNHNNKILSNYSLGSLNEFLATQSINDLLTSNPENIPNIAIKPNNYQSPSSTQKSRFSL